MRRLDKAIFTIGYGARSIHDFIDALKKNAVEVVCDVRSTPFSARYPQFSRDALAESLREKGIRYVFLGKEFGARPVDATLYLDGRASYAEIAKSKSFDNGVRRLENGVRNYTCAIMCAEGDPLDCHRSILIAPKLRSLGYSIVHIGRRGTLESQESLERRLLANYKLDQPSFLDDRSPSDILQEAYQLRGLELAYVPRNTSTLE